MDRATLGALRTQRRRHGGPGPCPRGSAPHLNAARALHTPRSQAEAKPTNAKLRLSEKQPRKCERRTAALDGIFCTAHRTGAEPRSCCPATRAGGDSPCRDPEALGVLSHS